MRKGESEGKREERSLENRSKSDLKREKARKDGLHRAKNERDLSKNRPESGSKWGKVGKTEILE